MIAEVAHYYPGVALGPGTSWALFATLHARRARFPARARLAAMLGAAWAIGSTFGEEPGAGMEELRRIQGLAELGLNPAVPVQQRSVSDG